MVRRDDDPVLPSQQRLRVKRVADVAADPVNAGRRDPVVRPQLPPQPRPEPPPRQRVCSARDLPVIGPRDDVAPSIGRSR